MKRKFKDEMHDELRPHYDELPNLLKNGVQGKYASRYLEGTNLVLLDHDILEAFPTEASVNEALRFVIQLRKTPSNRIAEQH